MKQEVGMTDRIASGFHPFVLPFLIGMAFVLGYCLFGMIRVILQLSKEDRRKFFVSLITPKTLLKDVKDIFLNCLIHVKLWKRNPVLGYMHSSIAFGWFMLIVLGHIEVILFVPARAKLLYYPIFFNYFVSENEATLRGAVLFFLMDFFLLLVLSGIALAIIKRFRSRLFGMRRTTKPAALDLIGLYSLWSIFPLRLIAESLTADISGGSFLTLPSNWLAHLFMGHELYPLPAWWAYSIALCIFMCVLPFTRYMHIPAEMMLIPMRNAGLKIRNLNKGFAKVEVLSCPGCGVCIDACPMIASRSNVKDCTVYLNRQLRRGNDKRIDQISDKCLLCGKCQAVCQVGVQGPDLRVARRSTRGYGINQDYSNISATPLEKGHKVLYFSGCMSQLTPRIGKAVTAVMDKAGVDYEWMDRDGGLCCGRPILLAGRKEQARQLIAKNTELILASGADTLVVNCPICYRVFREEYNLPGVRVVHHSEFFAELVSKGMLVPQKGSGKICYHDPCELGRGCGVYDAPRELLSRCGTLVKAGHEKELSICCGGSLGSLSLNFSQREAITRNSFADLTVADPDVIATACPLCLSTYSRYADRPVMDIAEILLNQQ